MSKLTRREFNALMGVGALSFLTPKPIAYALSSTSSTDWRDTALARIDQYRKGLFTITVVDGNRRPIPGAALQVRLQRHAFGFGSAVTAQLLNANTDDGYAYRAFVEQHFNRAVFENDLKEDA